MPDELDVMSGMASLDAINTNRISVCGITSLAPVEVMHGERRVTRYLVQALPICDRLFHRVLIIKNLIPSHNGLHTARQTQSTKPVIKNLVKLQGSCCIVRDLDSCSQPIEYPVPPQNRVALS